MLTTYWRFALACIVVALFLLRLVIRERISLQRSLALLVLMGAGAIWTLFPRSLVIVSRGLGFTLPSNFLLALVVGILVVVHVEALIALSKVEQRSVALTQEVGLVREQLERLMAAPGREADTASWRGGDAAS